MTTLTKPVRRITRGSLDGSFGRDRGRELIVSFEPGDVVTIKPKGLSAKRTETVSLFDLYRWAIRCRVNRGLLEKARERKAKMEAAKRDRQLRRGIYARAS